MDKEMVHEEENKVLEEEEKRVVGGGKEEEEKSFFKEEEDCQWLGSIYILWFCESFVIEIFVQMYS